MSSSGKGYSYTGSGTNSQGNHYCSRDYGTGSDRTVLVVVMHTTTLTGHNGSYYYSNSNGSTYYNDGKGGSTYTPSGGKK
ncbi:hypothetical protein CA14_007409 [Aspergillus flavus]|uniref:Uncharacterized protein n=1 Tax=Aspergillus flavus TaxID=5059 RepID=A0AB74C9A9_ASPFL|nr:hypothetical protein CA14_007409 [Aspergillus flavus]